GEERILSITTGADAALSVLPKQQAHNGRQPALLIKFSSKGAPARCAYISEPVRNNDFKFVDSTGEDMPLHRFETDSIHSSYQNRCSTVTSAKRSRIPFLLGI